MKPLDSAVRPAPEQSIRPDVHPVKAAQPPRHASQESRDRCQESHGELITAGSLDGLAGLDGSTNPGSVMPNYLEREEVNIVIRKLRQSYSFWKRIQGTSIDEQRLDEARDELLAYRQLIR
ncbi:hypothetical protein [Arthrobacter sp. USHLN218]|uniref:hypothetical protein n=1 Tax=Arthrobacter sp. USHLN218 TaxID=3081232 RepID=UPI003015B7BA